MDLQTSSLVARSYNAAKSATAADPASAQPGGFLGQAADDFAATMAAGEQAAMDAMTTGADPHALVNALAQTELAIETAVSVRNKVVEAYQEILRMPV